MEEDFYGQIIVNTILAWTGLVCAILVLLAILVGVIWSVVEAIKDKKQDIKWKQRDQGREVEYLVELQLEKIAAKNKKEADQ